MGRNRRTERGQTGRRASPRESRRAAREERCLDVLGAVVRAYVAGGQPVGSRTIVESTDYGISSATVRSLMAELEEQGYLHQPHTSSGRVPTEQGYRAHAEQVRARHQRQADETSEPALPLDLLRRADELPRFLHETSRVLSLMCRCVGLVLRPRLGQTRLQLVHFLRLDDRRVVAVLVGDRGVLSERIVNVQEPFGQDELEQISNYIVSRFLGQTLSEVQRTIRAELATERAAYAGARHRFLQLALGELDALASAEEVFVDGAGRCLADPDFEDLEGLRNLLRAYDEKDRFATLLASCLGHEGVQIHIGGGQGKADGLPGLAFIASQYGDGARVLGSVGVLGPTRMPYERVIAVVDRVARDVSTALQTGTAV